jgi:hypothetical protein
VWGPIMSYVGDFERDFMKHTLSILEDYDGHFEATVLINCLLGLLVVPRETCFNAIPEDPIENLAAWGIPPSRIKSFGSRENGTNLRGLVQSLRNAVAHFRFKPFPESGEVEGFEFEDASKFKAEIRLDEMRVFVKRMTEYLHRA